MIFKKIEDYHQTGLTVKYIRHGIAITWEL